MNQQDQYRNHTGGLYCGEGGVHVGRASTRVRAPPGGASSISFSNSSSSSAPQKQSFGVSRTGIQQQLQQERAPLRSINAQPQQQSMQSATPVKPTDEFSRGNHPSNLKGSPYRQDNQQSSAAPLFCGEGGVHVGRASVRVKNPPGGASSFSLGGG